MDVPRLAVIGTGLLLIVLGNVMTKSQPSTLSGLPLRSSEGLEDALLEVQNGYAALGVNRHLVASLGGAALARLLSQ